MAYTDDGATIGSWEQGWHGQQVDDADANQRAIGNQELIVVGVGASAGGLEALQRLVASLDHGTNMAFVVAQHVSADYPSMIVDLLQRHTSLPVLAAEHGQHLVAGNIYACPPGFHITVGATDHVSLLPVDGEIYVTKPSIDLLFKSIAEAKGQRSVGIVLSGTGSDGTSGVGAIKDVDGFSIAQEPSTAKYDGMPGNAINSGKVDLVLSPDEMGGELAAISPLADRPIPEFRSGRNRDAYERILRMLKKEHGVNFSLYKDKTLSRRIKRRMIATKSATIHDYAELVNEENELSELFHDLLIGVTEFFRDEDAYRQLETHLRDYIDNKAEQYLRIWSIGCSTGEEPYSIAILLAEILGPRLDDYRIQIFATDLNQRSVDKARRGRFSASEVSGLAQELREKYFSFVDGHFEVVKRLKQMIVFSQHDVTQDPPFLRQDLVVCRNVMIYFGSELQDSLLPAFHYVLHPGALLFLGQADSTGPHQALWETVSSEAKLFRATAGVHSVVPRLVRNNEFAWNPTDDDKQLRVAPRRRIAAEMDEVVARQLETMLAPSVVVLNAADKIVYSHGAANPLLQRHSGLSSDAIFDNMHPDMIVDLRTGLHRLGSGEEVVTTEFRRVVVGRDVMWARFMLGAAESSRLGELVVVYCQLEETLGSVVLDDGSIDAGSPALAVEHAKQVAKLREQLSIVMEQLDTSNEQMQALNEELQSSNEELQSSNEELETTNEELQATNEELQTAYAELRLAFDEKATQEAELEAVAVELQQSNDLLVLAEGVGQGGAWLWRPQVEELIWSAGLHGLLGTDPVITDPSFEVLLELVHIDDRDLVAEHLGRLLEGEQVPTIEFRLRAKEPRWVSMVSAVERGQYRSIKRIVGNLRDTTAERLARDREREQRLQLASVEEHVRTLLNESVNGIYIFDLVNGVNEFLSDSCCALLGWTQEELHGFDGDEFAALFHPDDRERIAAHQATVAGLGTGEGRTIRYRFRHKDGHWLDLYSRDSVYDVDDEGMATKMLGTFFVVEESVSEAGAE